MPFVHVVIVAIATAILGAILTARREDEESGRFWQNVCLQATVVLCYAQSVGKQHYSFRQLAESGPNFISNPVDLFCRCIKQATTVQASRLIRTTRLPEDLLVKNHVWTGSEI